MSITTPSHPEVSSGPSGPRGIYESKLYHDWYTKVGEGYPNDFIIAISANPATTGVSGTGKTTLGSVLAKHHFDHSEAGFDANVSYTLDPSTFAYDAYDATGEFGTIIYDEAQGTAASSGMNSKKWMKNEVIDAVNAIATRRSERKTVIIISQSIQRVVKDLYDLIDAWLLIHDEVDHVATYYKVHPNVFDFKSQTVKTPGVENITWQPLAPDDPDYQLMEQKKDESKRGQREFSPDEEDEDDLGYEGMQTLHNLADMPKEVRDKNIKFLDELGVTHETIGEAAGLTQVSVSRIVKGKQ